MEECDQHNYWPPSFTYPQVELRLKSCMRAMHKLKLIHKDIKLYNLLYSHSVGDLVLADFGLTEPIAE
jgi:serine/threonine protein kinase